MRLIDAVALINHIVKKYGRTEIILDIDEAPTIDAEPVVRCKNCKYWETVVENAEYGLCRGKGNYSLQTRAKNFYCADGEMDTEEE